MKVYDIMLPQSSNPTFIVMVYACSFHATTTATHDAPPSVINGTIFVQSMQVFGRNILRCVCVYATRKVYRIVHGTTMWTNMSSAMRDARTRAHFKRCVCVCMGVVRGDTTHTIHNIQNVLHNVHIILGMFMSACGSPGLPIITLALPLRASNSRNHAVRLLCRCVCVCLYPV